MDKLLSQFCEPFSSVLTPYEKELLRAREVRIRIGQPLLLCGNAETAVPSLLPDPRQMSALLLAFCGQALYAHEEQLRQGYLTLPGGHRVGVCGQAVVQEGRPLRFAQVQGMNVRIARQMSCERRALDAVCAGGALRSVLIVSPPGLGKTTMLRELARVLSTQGPASRAYRSRTSALEPMSWTAHPEQRPSVCWCAPCRQNWWSVMRSVRSATPMRCWMHADAVCTCYVAHMERVIPM